MHMKKVTSRICSLALAILLALGALPQAAFAAGETFSSGAGGEITAFEALKGGVKSGRYLLALLWKT